MAESNRTAFRVVTYNILCQKIMDEMFFLYKHLTHASSIARYEDRMERIVGFLKDFDADIIGLQEVEGRAFNDYIRPAMQDSFVCLWTKRNGEDYVDGCALLVRRRRFSIIREESVHLNVLEKPQIAQLALLGSLTDGSELVVSNTHLLYNPNRGDIRLLQTAQLLQALRRFAPKRAALIMLGDWNFQTGCPVFHYIVSGAFDFHGISRRDLVKYHANDVARTTPGPNIDVGISRTLMSIGQPSARSAYVASTTTWEHPFVFASVYPISTSRSTELVSSFAREMLRPDHVFYGHRRCHPQPLYVVKKSDLPKRTDLEREDCTGWPDKNQPSDHCPLVVDFAFGRSATGNEIEASGAVITLD